MTSLFRIFLVISCILALPLHADVPTNNTWTITSSDDNGATGTVTDSSLPGFSADFTITRTIGGPDSFGAATWTGGNEINLFNDRSGPNPGTGDSVQLNITFSNVTGGSIANIISEYGTTTNNDVDATWTYTWAGADATLLDPDGQMAEADNSTFESGGLVTSATSELAAASHTWCVTIPASSVALDWASPTHAFAEAMAFRIQLTPPTIPTLSTWGILALVMLFGLFGLYSSGQLFRFNRPE